MLVSCTNQLGHFVGPSKIMQRHDFQSGGPSFYGNRYSSALWPERNPHHWVECSSWRIIAVETVKGRGSQPFSLATGSDFMGLSFVWLHTNKFYLLNAGRQAPFVSTAGCYGQDIRDRWYQGSELRVLALYTSLGGEWVWKCYHYCDF